MRVRVTVGFKHSKVDKHFLQAALVPMEHRTMVPMDSCGRHLWQLTVGRTPPRGGGGGG